MDAGIRPCVEDRRNAFIRLMGFGGYGRFKQEIPRSGRVRSLINRIYGAVYCLLKFLCNGRKVGSDLPPEFRTSRYLRMAPGLMES